MCYVEYFTFFFIYIYRFSSRGPCGLAVHPRRWPRVARADVSPRLLPPDSRFQCVPGPVEPRWAQRSGPRALVPLQAGPTKEVGGKSGAGADPRGVPEGRGLGRSEERGRRGQQSVFRRRVHCLAELRPRRLSPRLRRGALHSGAVWIHAPAGGSARRAARPLPRPSRLQPPLSEFGIPDRAGRRLETGRGIRQAQKSAGDQEGVPVSGPEVVRVHQKDSSFRLRRSDPGLRRCECGELWGNDTSPAVSSHSCLQHQQQWGELDLIAGEGGSKTNHDSQWWVNRVTSESVYMGQIFFCWKYEAR